VKYSPGWWKAHRLVDEVHELIANLRRDWFFKLTDAYDFIFLEDLNLRGIKREYAVDLQTSGMPCHKSLMT
jgi:hypothetical protein